ncbi:efflux RND transporter periplasmic adaptor subunit [Paracoccus sp. S1E-3]|uniref:efflux RND transporter periplasmic adaptor subunit n=1 Tax=Paracoccus sp. S1E-3 TaxID=2756130 RepID=UPI0015EE8B3D|nr:efflux RND transporter periplasmic adaptor subunit [Paracoccus sp. S1E-3]MBA4492406.1 efflux RND transporter periplasmic adaptor subunit [Paracoccus sp. S1E-3]
MKIAAALLLGGAVLAGVVLYGDQDEVAIEPASVAAQPAAPAARELAAVDLFTVAPKTLRDLVNVSGELREVDRAVVKARVSGSVTAVLVRPGQAVQQGDVLLRFDREDLAAELRKAEAQLSATEARNLQAEQNLSKSRALRDRRVASLSALENAENEAASAQADVTAAEAQVETARNALTHAEVRAPMAGTVATRSVEIGETVANGSDLMTIVDSTAFEAEVLVATRDVTRLAVGQKAELTIDGLPGRSLTAEVQLISPAANEGTRFVPVFLRLDPTDARLFGGMFASGTITVREKPDAIAIPDSAQRRDSDQPYVLIVTDGRLQRRDIAIGDSWGREIEVTEGLSGGDSVLRAPIAGLVEGAQVSAPKLGG